MTGGRGRRSLDGDAWRIRPFPSEEAAVRAAGRDGVLDEPGWLPGHVPGSIADDLWRAGEIPDPYVERNSRGAEWAADRAWLYGRTIEALPLATGDRAFVRLEGLDFGGTVVLDGELLGRHDSMFAPVEWEIGGRLSGGAAHRLLVAIPPAPASQPQLGRTSLVEVHKSRMTYGWDFCPRLVHQGIWRSASLLVTGRTRIVDAWARPRLEPDGRGQVDLRIATDAGADARVGIEATLLDGDRTIGSTSASPASALPPIDLVVDAGRPRRWWPNGSVEGPPVVHRLTVSLVDEDGRTLDDRTVPVGFRTVELAPNAGAPPGARPYTLVVNGRPTYARGWNWVPLDVAYGVPRQDRLMHLLGLAHDANVNLLRVWGGGLIESDAFYEACDELGILVWQEFSLSSSAFDSVPSTEPAFLAALRRDARAIVPLRRNHPSLAIWCGGNELEDDDGPLEDARSPALMALHEAVRDLDPDRPWLPTSPSGPRFANRLDVIAADPDGLHDVHGPWEHQGLGAQQRLYDAGTSLLNSEFGVEGMTGRRSLEALVAPERRWPPTRSNPVYRHLGDWWINEPLVQASFGRQLHDVEAVRRASQWLQAEGLRYAVEANRRRWPRNSGSIPWQLNESFPNAWCTSAVDHRGDPKAAYFAVADAYRAVHVCASYATTAWGGDDAIRVTAWAWSTVGQRTMTITARLLEMDGTVAVTETWNATLASDGRAGRLGELELRLDAGDARPILLDLSGDGDEVSSSLRVPFSRAGDLAPFLDVPAAAVEADCDADCGTPEGDRWRVGITNVGPIAALGLMLVDDRPIGADGWARAADGWVHLLPGEQRSFDVRWDGAAVEGRRLRIAGWNVDSAVPPPRGKRPARATS
ncbi:MAG TPA: glycoside hydrolase family 2 TIM barrel-domain containing protein [Candidatus Limnocylindrales bacterium]|nr:glycoside hydrolase family 2 TIM barrel-domain containing protein [Candidatus Limnocylindrales bacterium]